MNDGLSRENIKLLFRHGIVMSPRSDLRYEDAVFLLQRLSRGVVRVVDPVGDVLHAGRLTSTAEKKIP